MRTGTSAAFTSYAQKFSSGAHVAEARQRVAALEAQARKADDNAWAEAMRTGTPTAFTSYLQKFSSGAHVAKARQRVAAMEAQASKNVPTIDIRKTCRAASSVMVELGVASAEQSVNSCMSSEQDARQQIVKNLATFLSVDRTRCMQANVYLPSYVEWLTCLEMEADVRKMRKGQPPAETAVTLPTNPRLSRRAQPPPP